MRKREITEKLLKKYFDGRCSGEEKDIVRNYLARNIDNVSLNNQLYNVWNELDPHLEGEEIKKAHLRYKKLWISLNSGNTRSLNLYKIVASFALLFAFSSFFFFRCNTGAFLMHAKVYKTGVGEQKQIVLPDSSLVTLNCLSSIKIPKNFNQSSRIIKLEGEAFFKVYKNKNKPFLVCSGNNYTRVLGTQFNVQNYANNNTMSVTVTEGKVEVGKTNKVTGNTAEVLNELCKNEQMVINKLTGNIAFSELSSTKAAISWKEGKLYFIRIPLIEITNTLERMYGKHFEYRNEEIKEMTFSANIYEGTSFKDVLEILNMTGKVELQYNNDIIYVEKNR